MLLSAPMRLFALLVVLAGCDIGLAGGADTINPVGDDGMGMSAPECATAFDCVTAGAKCCDCPTFAVPKADPAVAACKGVTCPMQMCPMNVEAACIAGRCELACKAETCSTSCADGYATDANGCVTCECAQVTQRTCQAAGDCAEVRGDCCGCALGGDDTAVPVTEVAAHDAALHCSANPSCPDVNTCKQDVSPQCVQGACELVTGLPATACGRPDLPDCTTGTTCTINVDAAASMQGVGVCLPPT